METFSCATFFTYISKLKSQSSCNEKNSLKSLFAEFHKIGLYLYNESCGMHLILLVSRPPTPWNTTWGGIDKFLSTWSRLTLFNHYSRLIKDFHSENFCFSFIDFPILTMVVLVAGNRARFVREGKFSAIKLLKASRRILF